MFRRWMVGGLLAGVFLSTLAIDAQSPRPLAPVPENTRVAPFFDGWYANPDGTISLSFGYSNLNKETVEIPLGPNNFITPKEFDGRQPTSFPKVVTKPTAGGGRRPCAGARPRGGDAGVSRGGDGRRPARPRAAARAAAGARGVRFAAHLPARPPDDAAPRQRRARSLVRAEIATGSPHPSPSPTEWARGSRSDGVSDIR